MSKNKQVKKSTNIEEIKRLYFEEHLTQAEIARMFNVSKQAISKKLNKDSNLSTEKNYKHNISLQKKKAYNQNYLRSYCRRKSTDTEDYYILQAKLDNDSLLLSSHKTMDDYAFSQTNSSIYKFDKKGNKILIDSMKSKVTYDVPRKIAALKLSLLSQGHHI